jgi:hypothetical protein
VKAMTASRARERRLRNAGARIPRTRAASAGGGAEMLAAGRCGGRSLERGRPPPACSCCVIGSVRAAAHESGELDDEQRPQSLARRHALTGGIGDW